MKNKQLAAILTGVLFAATTQLAVAAKGPEYTYAEIGYVNTDDNVTDGNGFDVNISFGATDLIFLKFGYQRDSLDLTLPGPATVGIDADSFLIGGGAHYTVMDKLDVYGALSYIDIEYSGGIPVRGDDGYQVDLGVRSMVTKELELNAAVAIRTIHNLENNDNDERIYSVGAVYKFDKDFSGYARIGGNNRYDGGSDAIDTIGLGVRLGL